MSVLTFEHPRRKDPPSRMERNASSECLSVLSFGLGALGLGAVLEKKSGWCEDEKTKKTKTPSPQPEATVNDSLESDEADMVLDHLTLLMDRLLDDEDALPESPRTRVSKQKSLAKVRKTASFTPLPSLPHKNNDLEDLPTSVETKPKRMAMFSKKTKAVKHKSLAKKEYSVLWKTAGSTSTPNTVNDRDDGPMLFEAKPKMRSSMISKIKKMLQMHNRKK
jgi:hypothetical protein